MRRKISFSFFDATELTLQEHRAARGQERIAPFGDIAANDNACGRKGMPAFGADLFVANQPYYLIVDGRKSSSLGAYGIGMAYE